MPILTTWTGDGALISCSVVWPSFGHLCQENPGHSDRQKTIFLGVYWDWSLLLCLSREEGFPNPPLADIDNSEVPLMVLTTTRAGADKPTVRRRPTFPKKPTPRIRKKGNGVPLVRVERRAKYRDLSPMKPPGKQSTIAQLTLNSTTTMNETQKLCEPIWELIQQLQKFKKELDTKRVKKSKLYLASHHLSRLSYHLKKSCSHLQWHDD